MKVILFILLPVFAVCQYTTFKSYRLNDTLYQEEITIIYDTSSLVVSSDSFLIYDFVDKIYTVEEGALTKTNIVTRNGNLELSFKGGREISAIYEEIWGRIIKMR